MAKRRRRCAVRAEFLEQRLYLSRLSTGDGSDNIRKAREASGQSAADDNAAGESEATADLVAADNASTAPAVGFSASSNDAASTNSNDSTHTEDSTSAGDQSPGAGSSSTTSGADATADKSVTADDSSQAGSATDNSETTDSSHDSGSDGPTVSDSSSSNNTPETESTRPNEPSVTDSSPAEPARSDPAPADPEPSDPPRTITIAQSEQSPSDADPSSEEPEPSPAASQPQPEPQPHSVTDSTGVADSSDRQSAPAADTEPSDTTTDQNKTTTNDRKSVQVFQPADQSTTPAAAAEPNEPAEVADVEAEPSDERVTFRRVVEQHDGDAPSKVIVAVGDADESESDDSTINDGDPTNREEDQGEDTESGEQSVVYVKEDDPEITVVPNRPVFADADPVRPIVETSETADGRPGHVASPPSDRSESESGLVGDSAAASGWELLALDSDLETAQLLFADDSRSTTGIPVGDAATVGLFLLALGHLNRRSFSIADIGAANAWDPYAEESVPQRGQRKRRSSATRNQHSRGRQREWRDSGECVDDRFSIHDLPPHSEFDSVFADDATMSLLYQDGDGGSQSEGAGSWSGAMAGVLLAGGAGVAVNKARRSGQRRQQQRAAPARPRYSGPTISMD